MGMFEQDFLAEYSNEALVQKIQRFAVQRIDAASAELRKTLAKLERRAAID